jgi:glycosyltransferase involved in cell wall biosynthesis
MSSDSSITVFFPAFNDEGSIASLVTDALGVLPRLTDDFEVLVVNDGSADATRAVLEELARASPHVRVIHHERNRGYGAALRTGFGHARKELVFYTDGDGQYDVRELAALRPLLTDAVGAVNGYKIKRSDARSRIVIGGAYNRLARLLFRLPIRDVDCDFRLMRRQAVERLDLVSSSGVICVELVRKLHASGCVFAEAPVRHYPRRHGRSQFFTFGRVARTAFDFFVLWFKLVGLRRFARGRRARKSAAGGSPVASDKVQEPL